MKTTRLWVVILSMALSGCASGYYQAGYGGYSANAYTYTAPRPVVALEYGYVAPVAPVVHYDSVYLPPRPSMPLYRAYQASPRWHGRRWHDDGHHRHH